MRPLLASLIRISFSCGLSETALPPTCPGITTRRRPFDFRLSTFDFRLCRDKNAAYSFPMKVELDIPDSALSALRQAPAEFAACLRLMAAAKLYETGNLSQERAAELAGQSRQDFVLQLSRLGVSPFQGVEDDLVSLAPLP